MENCFTKKRVWTFLPYGIAILRACFSPLLFYTFINDLKIWTISFFFFACFTDYLDGYFVRKLDICFPSSFESYLDATADFIIISTMFFAFALKQIYPFWVLFLIGIFFLQFIITSGLKSPLYDPIGKYSGLFFFIIIIITLISPPSSIINNVLFISIIGFTVISLFSRIVFLAQYKENESLIHEIPNDSLHSDD